MNQTLQEAKEIISHIMMYGFDIRFDTSNGFLSLEMIQETKTSFYEEIKHTITSCNVY